MPSTYRNYAVDYSNESHADIMNQPEDAIFSIANYLNKMGWKADQPIAKQLPQQKIPTKLVSTKTKLRYRIAYFKKERREF